MLEFRRVLCRSPHAAGPGRLTRKARHAGWVEPQAIPVIGAGNTAFAHERCLRQLRRIAGPTLPSVTPAFNTERTLRCAPGDTVAAHAHTGNCHAPPPASRLGSRAAARRLW